MLSLDSSNVVPSGITWEFGDKARILDTEFCYLDLKEGRFDRAESLPASIVH
jgi:hypothetical protein